MGAALKKADTAFLNGEFPVGCVIVLDNRIIADSSRKGISGKKKRFSEIDHAEILCLKKIENMDISYDLSKAVLFCTMEPCLMCYGAIILSGIKTIVYAYEDAMGGGTNCNLDQLPFLYKNSNIKVVSGIMRENSLALFYKFFNKKGNKYWKNSFLEKYTLKQAGKK